MVYIFIFIIFYFYYYFIYLASLTFTANHLGLDESVSRMVGEWNVICECSTPVGAPGRVTQIEHRDDISFSRHSRLIRFWEPDLANPVRINDVIDFFLQSRVKFSFFMVAYYGPTGARVRVQSFSLYKLFLFMYVYKVTPHLSNKKKIFLGFLCAQGKEARFPRIHLYSSPQVSCTRRCSQTS